jgi:hypothetical protein
VRGGHAMGQAAVGSAGVAARLARASAPHAIPVRYAQVMFCTPDEALTAWRNDIRQNNGAVGSDGIRIGLVARTHDFLIEWA